MENTTARVILNQKINSTALSCDLRREITNHFWKRSIPSFPLENLHNENRYLDFYQAICYENFNRISLKTHLDLCDLLEQFRDLTNTRMSLIRYARITRVNIPVTDNTSDEKRMVQASVDLVVRLWLMISVISSGSSGHDIGISTLEWSENEPLADILVRRFVPHTLSRTIRLERFFNAAVLEKSSGLKVFWTDNLVDHLRLRDDNTRVDIFHHASFLRLHQEAMAAGVLTAYPPNLISETLDTLSLLIPQYDRQVATWFGSACKKNDLDQGAGECGQLNESERSLSHFPLWGDRLIALKEAFDASEHQTLLQRLVDSRRDKKAWYETWAGFLGLTIAIFYGLIQCLEGGLQVYKAYYPTASK